MSRPKIEQQVTFLHTADLEKTAVFYQNILGLQLTLDQGACRIFAVGKEAFLGFCQSAGSRLDQSNASDAVILTLVSQDVDGWHDYLVTQGVPIEKPPTLNEKFNIYHCFLRDPNGYLLEIQRFNDPAWPVIRR